MNENKNKNNSFDFIGLLVIALLLGVGLTSLLLILSPSQAANHQDEATTLFAEVLEDEPPPEEILLYGVELEDLLFQGLPLVEQLAQARLRLIPSDGDFKLPRDRYWLLHSNNQAPSPPEDFTSQPIHSSQGLQLVKWSREASTETIHLVDQIQAARAGYKSTQNETLTPCSRWRFGRLFCGPNPWNWVGSTETKVRGVPSQCIWAHPLAQHQLEITFPQIKLNGVLKGKYALSDFAVDTGPSSPITFRVLINGEEKVKRILPNRKGWNTFRIGKPDNPEERVDLSFVVSSPEDGRRHFCFDAEIFPSRAKP